jgi:hypothetical protein
MPPKQRYFGEERRANQPKPVTRIQSFLQSVVTVGAVLSVGLSIHQAGKSDENRLTILETTDAKITAVMEEQAKTNKLMIEQYKADTEDRILILERLIRIERDPERKQDLREALKRAKAKRLQGKKNGRPGVANSALAEVPPYE